MMEYAFLGGKSMVLNAVFDEIITNDTPPDYSRKAQEEEGKGREDDQSSRSFLFPGKKESKYSKKKQIIRPIDLSVDSL